MADISNELQAIKTAVYGEEVRGSIHDGIKKINDEMEEAIEDIGDYADTLSDYVKDICPSASVSGGLISISDAAPLKVDSAVVHIVPAQTGSGTPSPENVRPFTGWTGATVRRTGKNLIDGDDRYIDSSKITFEGSASAFPTFLCAGQYTLSVEFLNGAHYAAFIRGSTDSAQTTLWTGISTTTQATFTLSNDGYYRIWLYKSDGVSSDNVGHVQLEPGSVATAYEPHQGDVYTVAFPSAAGTVYGGTLDLVAGTLTVDKAYVVLSDASKWEASESSSYNFLYNVNYSNRKKYDNSYTGLHCSYCAVDATPGADTARWLSAGANRMGLKLSNMTLTQVQADATAGKIAIVYDLAEPVVHTLDPVTLTMLRGVNILWADCGEMDLTYRQDVVHLIKAMLNPNEDDMVANTYYPEDSFFSINGKLYKATIAITSGESIVPGANGNCAETSIAEQLTAIYTILNA